MTNNNNDDDKETPLNELLLPTPAKLRGPNSEWKTLLAAYRRAAAAATVETKDDTTKNDDDDAAEATNVPQKSLRELSLSDTNGDAAADVTPHGADEGRDNDDGPRTSGSHCNRGNNPVATPPSRSFRNKTELVFIRGTGGNGKSFLTKKLSHYLQTSSSSSRQFHNFVTGQFDRNASNDDDGSDGGGTKGTVPYAAFRMAFNRLLEQFREETEPCGIRRERAAADDDDDDPLKGVVKEALGTGGGEALFQIVPQLRHWIDNRASSSTVVDDDDDDHTATPGSSAALHYIFRRFVQACVAKCGDRPLVLVLDDGEAADVASLKLLEGLFVEDRQKTVPSSSSLRGAGGGCGLLVIVCCREDEVFESKSAPLIERDDEEISSSAAAKGEEEGEAHPLKQFLETVEEKCACVATTTNIILSNLGKKSVNKIIATSLRQEYDLSSTVSLTEVVS